MKKIFRSIFLRYLIIGVLLPVFVQYVIYFRFTSNYMVNVFSEKNFKESYDHNIFRYRVLGKTAHLWLYKQLASSAKTKAIQADPLYKKRLTALDPDADPTFFLTYFILSTVFTTLSALALLYVFDSGMLIEMTELKKISFVSAFVMLSGFLEFVITPYDSITYFFIIISSLLFWMFLHTKNRLYFILLNLVIIASTLNHESSMITLSLIMAIYFTHYGFHLKWLRFVIIPILCYLLTWIGLRIYIHDSEPGVVTEGLKLSANFFELSGIIGFIFPVIAFYFLSKLSENPINKKTVRNFYLMASPYIIMIPLIGKTIESRLWMPVIIGAILLSQIDYSTIRFTKITERKNASHYPATVSHEV
jgi:hypothetical protein